MAIQSTTFEQELSYDDMFNVHPHELLLSFKEHQFNLEEGTTCNFSVVERINKNKINPVVRRATFNDINDIISVYRDIYGPTYPYKEMMDPEEVNKKITSNNVEWLVFESKTGEIAGCLTFELDFKKKIGYARGFNIKNKYSGKLDAFKACLGSFVAMYHKYNDKIFRWYAENRTAHAKSQYAFSAAGLKPLAFMPNKDIFFGKVESDVFMISYDHRALTRLRSNNIPQIIPEIMNCFQITCQKLHPLSYHIYSKKLNYDHVLVSLLKDKIRVERDKDRFGYEKFNLSIKGTDSYFKFLYTPSVKNFEKTEYKVDSLEELQGFLQKFIIISRKLDIRYVECFVSAYKPEHQLIFQDMGFIPRGYIPSWYYNTEINRFEDSILYNCINEPISKNLNLIKEAVELLNNLNLAYTR